MITPALSALLKQYPTAKFTFLTSNDGKRTLGDFSEKIQDFVLYKRGGLFPSLARHSIINMLKNNDFDHIYNFECHPEYRKIFSASKAKVHEIRNANEKKHYAQLSLDVVSSGLGHDVGFYPSFLPVQEEAKIKNNQYLSGFDITKQTLLLAIHPTFSGAGKWCRSKKHLKHKLWPPAFFGALADRLKEFSEQNQFEMKIVMNLMKEECWFGEKIIQASHNSVEILSPPPDFQQYKAFLKRVDLLITPDTGPMHIAAALGTKMVALFSGKSPEDCGPFPPSEQFKVLRAEDTEAPEKGIAAITVDDVYSACVEMMG
ncbi:MAG: glycosyltransferase family 9 protein [Nitrospiria bacterium]